MSEITPAGILLREMREVSFALTRKQWSPGIEFDLWAVLVGDSDAVDGKTLPTPVLAHIDALGKYADDCDGWFTADALEEGFISLDAWEERYAAWKAARRSA